MAINATADFFISYTRPDREWAEWIAWQLEQAGYKTAIQAWDFRPGQNFAVAMQEASVQAKRTIAVLSPAFFESRYTSAEWAAAFVQDPDGKAGIYLPVRVRDCEPPGLHAATIYIDLVGLEEIEATAALLTGVRSERATPLAAPNFPGTRPSNRIDVPDFPGDAPLSWNLPTVSLTFEGRKDALAELQHALMGEGRAAVTQTHAVYGLGGVGKTQLVARFAHDNRAEYDVIWWIRAEQAATRLADYAALGRKLDLPEATTSDQSVLVEATKQWLAQSSRWLLVFDNVADTESIASLLPVNGAGHVLITSRRHANWRALGVTPVRLDVWARQESVDFLIHNTGSDDTVAAEEIAALLGDLPLAIAQAAAYINQQAIELRTYHARLTTRTADVLAKGKPLDYAYTVANTWDLAFDQIASDPHAARLLTLCAYLAPERIPREILTPSDTHDLSDDAHSAQLVEGSIEVLLSYALLTPANDETLDMHRLVQHVVRERATEHMRRTAATEALMLVYEAFPDDPWNHKHWPSTSRLLPHAKTVVDYAQAFNVEPDKTAAVLAMTASFLNVLGDSMQARSLNERALVMKEEIYGRDDPEVARVLNNLGNNLHALGDLEGARSAQERSLVIKERQYGDDHREVAKTLNNLGTTLHALGELEGARSIYERAIAIEEAIYGPDHPEVARTLGNLGTVLDNLGLFAEARSMLERTLAIEEDAYGSDHPEVARTLGSLGNTLRDLGDLKSARSIQERALAIEETIYGPDHPEVARTLGNLSSVLKDLGLPEARSMLERAHATFEQTYGSNHPETRQMSAVLDQYKD